MSLGLHEFNNVVMHNWAVERLAESRNISLEESRKLISEMSFLQYHNLIEANGANITPPSGQTIGPSGPSSTPSTSSGGSQVKASWPGKGAPVEVGMTIGMKGPNGMPVPGEISQVDAGAKGVKVKNPTTGQDEWMNMDQMQPFMAQGKPGQPTQTMQSTAEDAQLTRLKELAGIKENCSAGATGAGAIAIAPAAMGGVKKRVDPVEESPSLEHEVAGTKSIIGATGPQASQIGKLSANLAATNEKTAKRVRNGKDK
jgi:hypothetical protein